MQLFSQRKGLGFYLAAWVPLAGLLALLFRAGGLPWLSALVVGFPFGFLYAFVGLSSWYLCRVLPLRETGILRLTVSVGLAALLSSSYWLLMGRLWASLLSRSDAFEGVDTEFARQMPLLFIVGVLFFLLAVASHYLMVVLDESRSAEQKAFELKLLAREAELKALRFQINPHFLFNSLNSVSALTSSDPKAARQMCLLLASFFRKVLEFGAQESITLQQELALIQEYLEIERVRRPKSLGTELSIDPEALDTPLPPLLLQPLVENAVKHGIAQTIGGGVIRIEARSGDGRLRIRIGNPFDRESTPIRGAGLGLKTVEKRLENVYGDQALLKIRREAESFEVELSLPVSSN